MRAAMSSCAVKDSRRLQVAIISLGPKLRAGLGIDELGAHPNAGASFADASLQHITRAEFGTQSPLVSSLSLQSRCRCAGNDRQIAKPRKPGRDFLAEAIGERLHLCVASTPERKHGDPELFARRRLLAPFAFACRNFSGRSGLPISLL